MEELRGIPDNRRAREGRPKNCKVQRSELGESVYAERDQTSQSRHLRAEHESRLIEELGPWVGLPEGAAHVNEEPGVCNEEGRTRSPAQSSTLDDWRINSQRHLRCMHRGGELTYVYILGEKHVSDQSYRVCFRPDKSEIKDLCWEIEAARDFLWCIDMIYKSTLPAMNINSISLAPHAADRAAENQDRRKWVYWLKEIEEEAVKGHVLDFDQNEYCTYNEGERELDKYPEDFAVGEEPTWWVMGSSKAEPPRKTERQQRSSSSSGQRQQTSDGSNPQQGASGGWSSTNDANKIDNEIIDSIFRMNSGGDDDRGVTLGGATVSVKFNIDANTGYPIIQTVFGPRLVEGKIATYWECMLRNLTSSLVHLEEKTSAEKIILS